MSAEESYVIGIDQSTQGTKALLFDKKGRLVGRMSKEHRQIVSPEGWVSHDPEEIYKNVVYVVDRLLKKLQISPDNVRAAGISNQRETSLVWRCDTGKTVGNAIVWQCARASQLCERIRKENGGDRFAGEVFSKTGIVLSAYFPAAKWAWILENEPGAMDLAQAGKLCFGTIDTWLVYKLTKGQSYKTDYSNASRTQLYHIFEKRWDASVADCFGIDTKWLAQVCDSDSIFGYSDFEGIFKKAIPICGVIGDSQAALFGQGALEPGMVKCTYGTGSSVMMNTGDEAILSDNGLLTSLAWGRGGKIKYVLEGNINYSGAVISWLKDQLQIIASPAETEYMCRVARQEENVYFIPAFTGLGAPYWEPDMRACILGMSRKTGKNEIVKAAVESIAYQIADVADVMKRESGNEEIELRADGGAVGNGYLMQLQSDLLQSTLLVSSNQELSGLGAAYMAGLGCGLYSEDVFENIQRKEYTPKETKETVWRQREGWKKNVSHMIQMYKK